MAFSKNNVPWNTGKKFSEATKLKMSLAKKGRKYPEGQFSGMKGKHHSDETKKKMSEASKGIPKNYAGFKGWKHSAENKAKMSAIMKIKSLGNKSALGHKVSDELKERFRKMYTGKKLSEEHKKKISESLKGCKGPSWKGGVTSESIKRTHSREWKEIRAKVYARDNWTCQICLVKCRGKGVIQCHHIVPYRITKDNTEPNLITLCRVCHVKEENKYYKRLG